MREGTPATFPTRVKSSLREIYASLPPRLRMGARYWRIKSRFGRAQWWGRPRIEQWQLQRLRQLIRYAYESVPGYRLLWDDARVKPSEIQALTDIKWLPFTSKELLRDNSEDFISRAIPRGKMILVSTSGSTGIPFGFRHTALNDTKENAFVDLGYEGVGWKLGDLTAVLRGGFMGTREKFWALDRMSKRLYLSSYFLEEETYDHYMEILERFKPRHIRAYPSSVTILADLILSRSEVGRVSFFTIGLSSENILDWQRARILEAFPGSTLLDLYGQTEQVVLSITCARSEKHHIVPFYGLVEITGEDGEEVDEGETGEIVGTSFWNFATPFIRYHTMDMARKGVWGCEKCGRDFPLIDRMEGRALERVVTKKGGYVPLTRVASIHSDVFNGISQFRFYQDQPGRVYLRIIPKSAFSAGDEERLLRAVTAKLGGDIDLEIVRLSEIPRGANGKHTFLDQRLSIPWA